MIVQPALIISKQRNQPNRECLYAWYPEAVNNNTATGVSRNPRDIYIHNGLDKTLLEQKPLTNGLANTSNKNNNNNNTSSELVQRYKQSIAPSDHAYHSIETIDEALNPPWALHYEIKRRLVTPNLSSKSTDMLKQEELPRRLKSAPVNRSLPPTAALTIPEPRFITNIIPVTITNRIPSPLRCKTRATSAKARIDTTVLNDNQQQPQRPSTRREIKSAGVSRSKNSEQLSDEEIEQVLKRVYGDQVEKPTTPKDQPIQIIYTRPKTSSVTPSPVYVYQKAESWCTNEVVTTPVRKSVETHDILLNPHHIHRPGHIAVQNSEKIAVLREHSALKKSTKYYRRHHHSHGKRNEPLLAVTPMPHKPRLSLEIDGVKLKYDPKLTLEDKSLTTAKYFVDGRLILIKDKCYNIFDNIDPSTLEKYNQSLICPSRSKYYQAIPMGKFQLAQPSAELHSRPSDTYGTNASSKVVHRYVMDPNVNMDKMSLSNRPPTTTVYA